MVKQRITKLNPHFWPKIPKANFQNGKMNTSPFNTMNYELRTMNYANKNKANSNPILSAVASAKVERIQFFSLIYAVKMLSYYL